MKRKRSWNTSRGAYRLSLTRLCHYHWRLTKFIITAIRNIENIILLQVCMHLKVEQAQRESRNVRLIPESDETPSCQALFKTNTVEKVVWTILKELLRNSYIKHFKIGKKCLRCVLHPMDIIFKSTIKICRMS